MRYVTIIGALVLILSASASAQPASADPSDSDGIHPNLPAIAAAIFRDRGGHCLVTACRPIDLIAATTSIIGERLDVTLGITWQSHINHGPIGDQRWPQLLSHPELFGAVCDTMTGLASRYQGKESHMGENIVAIAMLELAGRIDSKNNRCLARVLAAYPHIPAADRAIAAARNFCTYSREPRIDCKRIAR